MQNSTKKPKKPQKSVEIPEEMQKKASSREMIKNVLERQENQAKDITEIRVDIGMLKQKLGDFIDSHKAIDQKHEQGETKVEATKEGHRRLWMAIVGWAITIIIFATKCIMDALA